MTMVYKVDDDYQDDATSWGIRFFSLSKERNENLKRHVGTAFAQ